MTRTDNWPAMWEHAAFCADGFYRREDTVPAAHFRTSAHVGGPLFDVLADRLIRTDEQLGRPVKFDLVDVGAGRGELVAGLRERIRELAPDLGRRIRPVAIDLRARPESLPSDIGWIVGRAPDVVPSGLVGMLLAFELLDDVPIGVGDRAHDTRIELARALCSRIERGTAIFVDYALADINPSEAFVVGYRDGRQVAPIADGSMNLTSPVEMDSLTLNLQEFGTVQRNLQSEVIGELEVQQSTAHASSTIASFQRAGDIAELTEASGLGAHVWLQVDTPPRREQTHE